MKEPGPEHRAYTRTVIVTRLRDADNFSYADACRGANAIEELEAENNDLSAKLESLQRDLAARDATIAEMRERVKDYEDDYAAVVDEPCAPDEKHCTCVPILRRRIKELTAAEAKRFDLACAWRDTAEHIKAERDALRAKLEAAEKDARQLKAVLTDLAAIVRGECPALLDDDSGGDAGLSMAVDAALAKSPPAEREPVTSLASLDWPAP